MSNSKINNSGTLNVLCPYCGASILLESPIVDLYVYTSFGDTLSSITLKKTLSQKSENKTYIKTILLNTLKKKPIIARIIITKPYYDVINELIKIGFLTDKDLKNINTY